MITTVILFGITTGALVLLSLLFLSNITRVNVKANRWLGAFYFCLACIFIQQFMYAAGLLRGAELFNHILEFSRWATLPCFYLAVLNFVNPSKKSNLILLHFVPAVAFILFSLVFIMPGLFGSATSTPPLPSVLPTAFRYFFRVQAVVYWLLSFRLLLVHAKNIRSLASSIENINLAWIKHLLLGLLIMLMVHFASSGSDTVRAISPFFYFCGVCFVAYFSLRQEVIYPVSASYAGELEAFLNPKKGYERLTTDQVEQLKEKVDQITRTKKLFLDPSLTLPALSAETGINTHELSFVLNTGFNQNFYAYINQLRVEEAKQLLLSPKVKQLDMIGIATHAGFNSKTTFNTTFKRLTGQTPSEYLKENSKR